jgi:hypothetical protein
MFNTALQQIGNRRFSAVSHGIWNIISFGPRALPVPVAHFGR